jgi:uncharacterized membrane protein YfcA
MKKIIISSTFGLYLGLFIALYTNSHQLMIIFSFVTGICFAVGMFLLFDRKKNE